MKGYLVFHKIDFPYTHNTEKLLMLCKTKSPKLFEELKSAVILTDYSVTTRYPGLDKTISKDEAINAVKIAEKVMEVISNSLKQDGSGI
ncbi:HEPN domain-containing protein [bacterium]|nr:HEPN domain-containing protein [bacterium]